MSEPVLPSFSVANEVALVTGASSGIGLHLAEILALAGAKVALAARRADRLAELAREIEARGGECLPLACDVLRWRSTARSHRQPSRRIGPGSGSRLTALEAQFP